jgi:hypothetical protein
MMIAARAIGLGLPVFPCRNTPDNPTTDKAPTCPGGFKAAVSAPDAIRDLWRRWPGPLIGVPTGAVSGIDVLDVDRGKGGGEWYAAHRAKLPLTRIHRTRSGGLHVLFRHLEGLRLSAGKIAPGIDVRADGGYVIWWPACGLDVRGHPLDALPEWPLWLLPALFSPPVPPPPVYPKATSRPATLPAIEGLIRTVATAPQGQRNAVTYWAAHRMRESVAEGAIGEGLAREILIEAAARAGLHPREAALTINSAMRGSGRG